MTAKLIDGREVSGRVRDQIKEETVRLKKMGITPGLAVILAGDDPASKTYVKNKKKACEELGFYSRQYDLPGDVTQAELMELVESLNADPKIHGILVQLPLPRHLNEKKVLEAIDPRKDVDCFHPVNVGKVMIGDFDFLPCTPAGIMTMLDFCSIDPAGKSCVVIGRSNIVGKPMAMLLLHRHGTVTVCHSKTPDLKEVCRRADILVAAVGRPLFVTADMVKPGATVIDVGMNRHPETGKLCGDVDFDAVSEVAGAITPVPGGVGPMTITTLMQNTLKAARMRAGNI